MFQSIISLFLLLTFVSSLPTNKEIDAEENVINVDEKPAKAEEPDLSSIPLGSQFAVEYFFPERKNLETGHRLISGFSKHKYDLISYQQDSS